MLSEVNIAGVYFAPIVVYAVAGVPVAFSLRFSLWRVGLLRFAWHPALFVFSLYVSIVSLLVLFV
jgi:hypothetical protein